MRQAAFVFFSLGFLFLTTGCESTPPDIREPQAATAAATDEAVGYSDGHIDYKMWKRDSTCCTADGAKVAIAAGARNSSKCGLEVTQAGGNVIDAAVATAFCLAVERPQHTGLGGGGFLTYWDAKTKKAHFVDFRETAPKKATEKMYQDKDGKVVPNLSLNGGLAVATPGFVAGFFDIHKKWGKLPWAKCLAPSIALARRGFAVYPSLVQKIQTRKDVIVQDENLKSLFVPDGKEGVKEGIVIIQEDLAKTLEIVANTGKSVFYRGAIAKDISAAVKAKGGVLEESDLANYTVKFSKPMEATVDGYRILTAPPPSAGGMIVLQAFQTMRALGLDKAGTTYAAWIHGTGESMKRAFADRSQYIGDPAFFKDRTFEKLITADYAKKQAASIDMNKATPAKDVLPAGQLKAMDRGNTTQLSLVDGEGNAVSSTITLNFLFGAGFSVPKRGIILNDEMDDFSAKTGEANLYGLTGSTANKIQAGKRPVSSMCPTIVLKNSKPVLVLGAPGGSYIPTAVLEVLWHTLVTYHDAKKAVFSPRVHHQWLPDTLFLEQKGIPATTLERLKTLGHTIEEVKTNAQIAAIYIDPTTGQRQAVFDPRDEGGADAQ